MTKASGICFLYPYICFPIASYLRRYSVFPTKKADFHRKYSASRGRYHYSLTPVHIFTNANARAINYRNYQRLIIKPNFNVSKINIVIYMILVKSICNIKSTWLNERDTKCRFPMIFRSPNFEIYNFVARFKPS